MRWWHDRRSATTGRHGFKKIARATPRPGKLKVIFLPKPQPPIRRGLGEQELRPTTWGGARHELAAQTTAPSTQRAVRALWAVGWFSTGRRARAPRATGLERDGYDGSKPHPPTWCSVGGEEPRPTAWGGARRELASTTTEVRSSQCACVLRRRVPCSRRGDESASRAQPGG